MRVKLQSKHVDEADIRLMCETMRGNTQLLDMFHPLHNCYTIITASPGITRGGPQISHKY